MIKWFNYFRLLIYFRRHHGEPGVEGGAGGSVEGARIGVDVVVLGVADHVGGQLQVLGQVLAEDGREELAVGDVLQLGGDDASRLLEQRLVVPQDVQVTQFLHQTVVLPVHQRVQHRQRRVLVDPHVARIDATNSTTATTKKKQKKRGFSVAPSSGNRIHYLSSINPISYGGGGKFYPPCGKT